MISKNLILALARSALSATSAFADYQWVGASCAYVTPNGDIVSSGYPADDCPGANYQWVGASCAFVAPNGSVVSSGYPASDCPGY